MTREEEIQEAIKTLQVYVCGDNGIFECSECIDSDIQNAFYQGAKWADKHPKSPWISIDEDLPCNHEELMEPICQLDDRLIYETKRVFVRCRNNSLCTAHMVNLHNKWKWYPEDIHVEHWMPIPDLTEKED